MVNVRIERGEKLLFEDEAKKEEAEAPVLWAVSKQTFNADPITNLSQRPSLKKWPLQNFS